MRRIEEVDVTAPASRHSLRVGGRSDLEAVSDWSADTLYAAVRRADEADDGAVVLDHGRASLYVAPRTGLRYESPGGLGLWSPPALHVADPRLFDPEGGETTPTDPVSVSPEFDVLVPAFDREELTEGDLLPPTTRRPSESPSGAGTGTPN